MAYINAQMETDAQIQLNAWACGDRDSIPSGFQALHPLDDDATPSELATYANPMYSMWFSFEDDAAFWVDTKEDGSNLTKLNLFVNGGVWTYVGVDEAGSDAGAAYDELFGSVAHDFSASPSDCDTGNQWGDVLGSTFTNSSGGIGSALVIAGFATNPATAPFVLAAAGLSAGVAVAQGVASAAAENNAKCPDNSITSEVSETCTIQ